MPTTATPSLNATARIIGIIKQNGLLRLKTQATGLNCAFYALAVAMVADPRLKCHFEFKLLQRQAFDKLIECYKTILPAYRADVKKQLNMKSANFEALCAETDTGLCAINNLNVDDIARLVQYINGTNFATATDNTGTVIAAEDTDNATAADDTGTATAVDNVTVVNIANDINPITVAKDTSPAVKYNLHVLFESPDGSLYGRTLVEAPADGSKHKDLILVNVNGNHWEVYGNLLCEDDRSNGRDVSGFDIHHLSSHHFCKNECVRSQVFKDRVMIEAATKRYRQIFKLADDIDVSTEEVLLSVPLDANVAAAHDSESDDDANVAAAHDSESDDDANVAAAHDSESDDDEPVKETSPDVNQKKNVTVRQVVSLLPKFGEGSIPENTPLVRLINPRNQSDKKWKQVGSSHIFRASFRTGEMNRNFKRVEWLPSADSKKGGLAMEFSIDSQDLAPKLRLTIKLMRDDDVYEAKDFRKPVHVGCIEFSFGRVFNKKHDTSSEPNQIFDLRTSYPSDRDGAMLTFTTKGCLSSDLRCLIDHKDHPRVGDFRLRDDEKRVVKEMVRLTELDDKSRLVQILLLPDKGQQELHKAGQHNNLDKLINMLPWSNNPCPKQSLIDVPYKQYRTAQNRPRVQHNQMPERAQTLIDGHPAMPMKGVSVYRDADEALIRLGNSVYTQFKEEKLILATIESHLHRARLLTVGDMVLARVNWEVQSQAGLNTNERITVPEGTKVKLEIFDSEDKTWISDSVSSRKATGIVIKDVYDVRGGMLLVLRHKVISDFAGLTTPLNAAKSAKIYWCRLSSKIPETSVSAMIDGLSKTFSRESWVLGQWPALLSDGAELPSRTLLGMIPDLNHAIWGAALKSLLRAKSWNRRQLAFINQCLKPSGGMAICDGPGGAGKTALLIYLTKFLLELGVPVVIIGMKHSTLDMLAEAFDKEFPDLKPLRAYSPSLESLTTDDLTYSTTDVNELLLLDVILEDVDNLDNKRSLKKQYSVQWRAIANAQIVGRPLVGKIASGSRGGKPVYEDHTEYDFRDVFARGLEARKLHRFSDKEHWNSEALHKFQTAYAAMRAEVIQESPLALTTSVNVSNTEFSQNFGKSAKAIARFDDEAQAISEPAALIAAASCTFSPKIILWAMLGDLRQTGVLSFTGNGQENTVDEFKAQSQWSLMSRLAVSGFLITRLTVQWRQHEELFKPCNERFYDLQVQTDKSMKGPLKEGRALMAKVSECDEKTAASMTDAQLRMLYVEVEGALTMQTTVSKSRANPGFAAFVVQKVFPVVHEIWGKLAFDKVMLLVPYARQIDLYRHAFFELRKAGWGLSDLPFITTIEGAHGHQRHLVIFDLVNADDAGFLHEVERCCVAWTRPQHQIIVVGGDMSRVRHAPKPKRVKDATDSDKWKTVKIREPLSHFKAYYDGKLCLIHATAPKTDIPADLEYYGAAPVV